MAVSFVLMIFAMAMAVLTSAFPSSRRDLPAAPAEARTRTPAVSRNQTGFLHARG